MASLQPPVNVLPERAESEEEEEIRGEKRVFEEPESEDEDRPEEPPTKKKRGRPAGSSDAPKGGGKFSIKCSDGSVFDVRKISKETITDAQFNALRDTMVQMLSGKGQKNVEEKPQKPLTAAAIASLKAKILKGIEKSLKKNKFCYDRYGMAKRGATAKYDMSGEFRQYESLFGSQAGGTLVSKENSKNVKKTFSPEEISEILGLSQKKEVPLYKKQNFGKSFQWGSTSLVLEGGEVTFSSSTKKLVVKAEYLVDDDCF